MIANVNLLLGFIYQGQGVPARAKHLYMRAVDLARKGGDLFFEARALHNLGAVAEDEGAPDEAEAYYRQSITLFRQTGDRLGLSIALPYLGLLLEKRGQLEAAKQHYLESLEAARGVGSSLRVIGALNHLGSLSLGQEHYDQAEAYYTESLSIMKERNEELFRVATEECLIGLGKTAHALGKYGESLAYFRTAIAMALELSDSAAATRSVVGVADLLVSLRERDKALALLAFALEQPEIDESTGARARRLRAKLEAQLCEPTVASAQARGRTLCLNEIADLLASWQHEIKS